MTVTLTSPVLGQAVGTTYTGNLEAWLLAQGYASQAAYTGAGVSNTGSAGAGTANDPRLPANREAPLFPLTPERNATIANDGTNLTKTSFPHPDFDFGASGADTKAPRGVVPVAPVKDTATGTKAKVAGSGAAVNIVTGGNLVLSIDGGSNVTVALATSDTPAAVVTKINTALGSSGSAALNGSTLEITTAKTGTKGSVTVVSGTGTVLANLSLTAGQSASGTNRVLSLAAAGGDKVVLTGLNLVGTTGVTFGGTAGTSLDASQAREGIVRVTAPAKTAGTYNVVVTDSVGSLTLTGAAVYA